MRKILTALLFLVPGPASAAIILSEIMYDLPGGDQSREWVEVFNSGIESVDLTTLRFRVGDDSCPIRLSEGGVLSANGYAIIADSSSNLFKTDWPQFSDALYFVSCMDMKNTSDTISINDGDVVLDEVTYSSDLGGSEDGKSLNRGNPWFAASPTPGAANASVSAPPPQTGGGAGSSGAASSGSETSSSGQGVSGGTASQISKITADAGEDRTTIVGAPLYFIGKGYGLTGAPLQNARYVWNFGDGGTAMGERVSHTYTLPGSYNVFLDVSSAEYSAIDRIVVKAIASPISISAVKVGPDGYIEISNVGDFELDLSSWIIGDSSFFFSLPENTFITAHGKLVLPAKVTGFEAYGISDVTLYYPNGTPAVLAPKFSPAEPQVEQVAVTYSDTDSVKTDSLDQSNYFNDENVKDNNADSGVDTLKPEGFEELTDLTAAAVLVAEQDSDFQGGNIFKWLFGLAVLIIVGLVGLFLLPRKEVAATPETAEIPKKLTADDFEIL